MVPPPFEKIAKHRAFIGPLARQQARDHGGFVVDQTRPRLFSLRMPPFSGGLMLVLQPSFVKISQGSSRHFTENMSGMESGGFQGLGPGSGVLGWVTSFVD